MWGTAGGCPSTTAPQPPNAWVVPALRAIQEPPSALGRRFRPGSRQTQGTGLVQSEEWPHVNGALALSQEN